MLQVVDLQAVVHLVVADLQVEAHLVAVFQAVLQVAESRVVLQVALQARNLLVHLVRALSSLRCSQKWNAYEP
jgi:uncharacterized protein (DUF2235 family)